MCSPSRQGLLLCFPGLRCLFSQGCYLPRPLCVGRRAGGQLPAGTAATVASGMVYSSVIVRERVDWLSETKQGKHQDQLTHRYAGTMAKTWTWASDIKALRSFIGCVDLQGCGLYLGVLVLGFSTSLCGRITWEIFNIHSGWGPPPEILSQLVWGGVWHL